MKMNIKTIKDRLGNEGISVSENVPMARFTSFRAGGHADLMAEPRSVEELRRTLAVLEDEGCPRMVLGNGSNILVKDGGYRGVMVRIGQGFDDVEVSDDRIECGCGCLMTAVAKRALDASLEGLEFASGIPGSIGGAVFMNAGAYGGEIRDVLEKVHVISADGSRDFYLTADEMDMGYRHSLLHETGDIAVSASFLLKKGEKDEIRARMEDFKERRNTKQPVNYPSAGSFFKRPEGYFAGKLVQDADMKGVSVGGAEVSTLHSGFIINKGGATATDIIELMEMVQARVLDRFGVELEPEVRIIGE